MGIGKSLGKLDNNVRLLLYAFLSWLLPFVFSFMLYTPEGKPILEASLTHNILMVFGSVVGAALLLLYFKRVPKDFLMKGAYAGAIMLLINWALDVAILLPMAKMDLPAYFGQIGVSYIVILVMAVSMGYAIEKYGGEEVF